MEKLKQKIEETGEHLIEYVETQFEVQKMQFTGKASKAFSSASSILLLAFIFLLVIIFFSITAALVISAWTGSFYMGFLAIALVYLLGGIIIFMNRKTWIEIPLTNSIIKAFYKDDNED